MPKEVYNSSTNKKELTKLSHKGRAMERAQGIGEADMYVCMYVSMVNARKGEKEGRTKQKNPSDSRTP